MMSKEGKVILSLLSAVLLVASGATMTIGSAMASNYSDIAGPAWQGQPMYYITTNVLNNHEPTDGSLNVLHAKKWSTIGSAENYYLNADDATWESGYSLTEAEDDIEDVENEWTSLTTISNGPIMSYAGTTTAEAGLVRLFYCENVNDVDNDGQNTIEFCDILNDALGAVVLYQTYTAGTTGLEVNIEEADMVLDTINGGSTIEWGDTDPIFNIEKVVRHEMGHFIMALGDVYAAYNLTNALACDDQQSGDEEDEPIMCHGFERNSLHEGDKAGAAFMYPKRYSQSLASFAGTIVGADSAVGTLGHSDNTSNSLNDMLIVYADYNPSDSRYHIRIRPLWDIVASTGQATTVGPTVNMLSSTSTIYDVGATLANINNSGSLDLVISFTADVSGVARQHFITFFDVRKNVSTNGLSIPSWSSTYSHTGATPARGSDVVIFNFDSDNSNEIGLMHTRQSTDTRVHLYIADINTSGVPSGLFSAGNSGHSSLAIPVAGGDAGFSIVGINTGGVNDQRMFSVNYDGDDGYVRQHFFHVNGTFWISHGWIQKYGPLYDNGGNFNGIGSGDSVLLDNDGDDMTENFHVYVIGTTAYYTIEWQNRWNSHP